MGKKNIRSITHISYIKSGPKKNQWQTFEVSCLYRVYDHSLVKHPSTKENRLYCKHNKFDIDIKSNLKSEYHHIFSYSILSYQSDSLKNI